MLSVCFHAISHQAFSYLKAEMGSLTCTMISVHAEHMKVSRVLTGLHKCELRRAKKHCSFTLSGLCVSQTHGMVAAFTGSSVQHTNHAAMRPDSELCSQLPLHGRKVYDH